MSFSKKPRTVSFVFFFVLCNIFLSSLASATNVGVSLLETPEAVVVTPSDITLTVGIAEPLTATAIFSSESPDLNVTTNSLTMWTSNNEDIATVDDSGIVTAVSPGSTTIRATYGGKSDTTSVAVVAPPSSPRPSSSSGGFSNSRITGNDSRENPLPTPPPSENTPERPASSENPPSPPIIEPRPNSESLSPRSEVPALPETTHISPPVLAPFESGISESSLPTPPVSPPPPDDRFVLIPDENRPSQEGRSETVFHDEALIGFFPTDLDFQTAPDTAIIQTDFGPVILPSELSVSRGEILHNFLKTLDVENVYKDLLDSCSSDLESCLSIFLNTTSFEGVQLDIDNAGEKALSWWRGFIGTAVAASMDTFTDIQLYPDVSPTWPYSRDVNVATVLGIVQGYYTEPNSPFKPQQALTRMEAVKISLGAIRMVKWMYYDELEALLGGPIGIKAQKTPFADVTQDKTYMWWYPRYLNEACRIEIIDCTPGHNFRPQDYITDNEMKSLLDRLKKYTDKTNYLANQNADNDGDKIKNFLEQSVYLTDAENPDTDEDKLLDGEEIFIFKTSPFLKDTDFDALDDYDEVNRYKTNPLLADTDGDGFHDSIELVAKTDPLDVQSYPQDQNSNLIDDAWEKKYNLNPEDVDTDEDGISNTIEYQFVTNPLQKDTDGDGFSDAQEVLEFKTDPLNAQDPGTIGNLGVRITNLDENQTIVDNTPFIKGVAPVDSQIRILLRNDFGAEKVLGDTLSDENGVFTFQVQKALRAGTYQVVVRALQPSKKAVIDSMPVRIIINPNATIVTPKPDKLADETITDEILIHQIRVEIEDRQPVLIGRLENDFGSKVTATWKSVVATSALIADNISGEFRVTSPRQLELGNHEVYVTATRTKDGIQSKTIKIPFVIGASLDEPDLKSAADEQISKEIGSSGWLLASFLGASILAFTFACLQHVQKKKRKS